MGVVLRDDALLLRESHRELMDIVERVTAERLDERLVGEGTTTYSIYAMLHGIIEHDLYHAGQIAILKRASARRTCATSPPTSSPGRRKRPSI